MNPTVGKIFAAYPPKLRKRLLAVRQMIFDVAKRTEGVGKLQETLKWGEPAYVTAATGSGSTIRNRCIVFDESERVPAAELKICIGMALTYHQKRARDWNATS